MSTTISTSNNCPNGNCDNDGDDTSDLKSPEENNIFQVLSWGFLFSFGFSLIYYFAIQQQLGYDLKLLNIYTLALIIYGFSSIITAIYVTKIKNKDSSCSDVTIWTNSFFTWGFLILVIFAIGLGMASCFESDLFKFKDSPKILRGKDLSNWFSKNNPSVAINIFLGYPIILLLVWNGSNSANCIF